MPDQCPLNTLQALAHARKVNWNSLNVRSISMSDQCPLNTLNDRARARNVNRDSRNVRSISMSDQCLDIEILLRRN